MDGETQSSPEEEDWLDDFPGFLARLPREVRGANLVQKIMSTAQSHLESLPTEVDLCMCHHENRR